MFRGSTSMAWYLRNHIWGTKIQHKKTQHKKTQDSIKDSLRTSGGHWRSWDYIWYSCIPKAISQVKSNCALNDWICIVIPSHQVKWSSRPTIIRTLTFNTPIRISTNTVIIIIPICKIPGFCLEFSYSSSGCIEYRVISFIIAQLLNKLTNY